MKKRVRNAPFAKIKFIENPTYVISGIVNEIFSTTAASFLEIEGNLSLGKHLVFFFFSNFKY